MDCQFSSEQEQPQRQKVLPFEHRPDMDESSRGLFAAPRYLHTDGFSWIAEMAWMLSAGWCTAMPSSSIRGLLQITALMNFSTRAA